MKIFAVYFSGTGNTEYALQCFLRHFAGSEMHSIEENIDFAAQSKEFDTMLAAYPIYGSDMPCIMRDFLKSNAAVFYGKNLITLATQYAFSGDGGMLAFRILKKGIRCHVASLHINMPSNINLTALIPVKNGAENQKKLEDAEKKISACADKIINGKKVTDGRSVFCFLAGFLFQRLWYRLFVIRYYRNKLKVQNTKCTGCGLCEKLCPAKNMKISDNTAVPQGKCNFCYRCINRCPHGAITLFSPKDGKRQYRGISI